MTKLVSGNFVKNEAHCIEYMLDSVQPFVDESYVLVDDTTSDNTYDICERRGCKVKLYSFENFSKSWNTLLSWMNPIADWGVFIAPDETISTHLGENLKILVGKMSGTDVEGVWFSRKHWKDLEMVEEYTKFNSYPDWQLRLLKIDYPRIYLKNYVHEWPVGIGKTLRIQEDINHFNVYWKDKILYNFEEMYRLYDELKIKQQAESGINIWPEEENNL